MEFCPRTARSTARACPTLKCQTATALFPIRSSTRGGLERSEMAALARPVATAAALALVAMAWLWGANAMAVDGLITKRSNFGPEETMKRLEADVKAKGLTVFAHVDHAA